MTKKVVVYLKDKKDPPTERVELVIAKYFLGNTELNISNLTQCDCKLFKPGPKIHNKIVFIIANELSGNINIFHIVKEILLLEDVTTLVKSEIVQALFVKESYVEPIVQLLFSPEYSLDFLLGSLNGEVESKKIKRLLTYKAKKESKINALFQHQYIILTPIELKDISKSPKQLEVYIRNIECLDNKIDAAIFLEWLEDFGSCYYEEFKERFG